MDTPAYLVPGIVNWLLILPISDRLYTSVKPWNPEKCTSKVSCATDLSPTTILYPWLGTLVALVARPGGEGVPGVVGTGGWSGGAIPVPRPSNNPGPYLVYIWP